MNKESEADRRRIDVNSLRVLWNVSRVVHDLINDVEFRNDWEPKSIGCVE